MLFGGTNALETVLADGRHLARRFAVYACRIEAGASVRAEPSEAAVEELALPERSWSADSESSIGSPRLI
jgi:hypothetical protein